MGMTDEQIMACLLHDGDRTAMLKAAYRMGMLRAAEVCESHADSTHGWITSYAQERMLMAQTLADAIRAEAGEG